MIQAILLVVITLVAYWMWKYEKSRLPPGPIRFPILGSIPQLMMIDSFPHLQFHGLAKKYGDVVSFGYGVHYAVLISSFEALRDIFRRTETNLERYTFEFTEERANYKNIGIIWGRGEEWKKQRKFTFKLLRQLGFGKKQSMDNTFQAEVTDLVRDIRTEVEQSNGTWAVSLNRLGACQINIIWASVDGARFDPNSDRIKRHLELHYEFFEAMGPKNLSSAFPFLAVFPKWSGYAEVSDNQRKCREFTYGLIEEAKKRRGDRKEAETFIEAYLDEIEKQKSDPIPSLTEEQLVLILMDIFVGGADTSSVIINWLLLYLGVFPEIQNRARAEIRKYTGGTDCQIPATALASMPYIHASILETMRHAPFLPSSLPRLAKEDIHYGDYIIPKGSALFPNYYSIFHDEKYWGDPEVFRPERMLMPDGSLDPSKVERVVQFGVGARICPGEDLAMTTMFLMTAGILRHFEFETVKVDGKEPSLVPIKPSITHNPPPYSLKIKILEN